MAIPFDLWGQRGYPHADIVGESHYAAAIRDVLGNDFKVDGSEVIAVAELVPEPGNRHDQNAVAVRIGGQLVGYLPRDEAARYSPALFQLVTQGWSPQVACRVWGASWDGNFRGSVRLDLAEPHLLAPANRPPGGEHRLLPPGHAIQVTGEEHHLDALLPFLRPEGECWVHATLHEVVEQTARTSKVVVEVRLDGARVGKLSPRMSGELLPAIQHLAGQGRATVTRALVKGNRIKTEVTLYALRAHELPHSWLGPASPISPAAPVAVASVIAAVTVSPPARPHQPIPPPPTGVRFAVPPGWPQPPPGWAPPAGWNPDPSWPPAPHGWQWWELVWD
ncbi:HIRAN domain-containing protein [Actinoplanes sp. CA-142083]|uniref:HIRAN domain-containing protein n=1 Tax=Actinoplanes sp. CA-142083 TaxID=3239903 RepID=UPI003D8DECAE